MSGNTGSIKIEIMVDDQGSVKVRKFGEAAESAAQKGERSFAKTGKSLEDVNAKVASTYKSFLKLAAATAAITAVYMAVQKLKEAITSAVETAKTFERLNVSLRTITGSAEAAGQAMDWITDFTAKTPYELDQVAEAFVRMQAQGLNARDALGMLGDTASAMGKDLMQAVEMFADAVRGENERLKEFGVVAKTTGDEIQYSWSENGQNMTITANKNAEDITAALMQIFSRFEGGMEEQSKTWEGMVSNMSDQWTLFKRDVMDSGPFQAMKEVLKTILDEVNRLKTEGRLDDWASATGKAIVASMQVAVEAVGVFLKAWGNIAGSILMVEKALTSVGLALSKIRLWFNKNDKSTRKYYMEWQQSLIDIQNELIKIGEKQNIGEGEVFKGLIDKLDALKTKGATAAASIQTIADKAKENKNLPINIDIEVSGWEEAIYQIELIKKLSESGLSPELLAELKDEVEWQIDQIRQGLSEGTEEIKKEAESISDTLETLSDKIKDSWAGESFGDSLASGLNNAMISLVKLIDLYEQIPDLEKEIFNARRDAYGVEDIQEREAALKQIANMEEAMTSNQLGAYRELFGTTSQLFEENSDAREKMHQAEMAFAAAEIAIGLEKAVTNAVVAITTQGSGDPYTAFARVAAMAAMMAAVLSQIGGSVSGGGGGSSVSASTQPESTVLGAEPGTGSESISNAYDMLMDIDIDQYNTLRDIYDEMKDLNSNITGLVTAIIKGGVESFSLPDATTNIGVAEKYITESIDLLNATFAYALGPIGHIFDNLNDSISGFIGSIVGWVVGGASKIEALSTGIMLDWHNDTTMGDILDGMEVDVLQYVNMKKKTKGWFGSSSNEFYTEHYAMGDEVDRLFTKIFMNMAQTMVAIDEGLGAGKLEELLAYAIDIGQIDLTGKNAGEIEEAIQNAMSNFADVMAGDLFGDIIKQYQQIGEGLFETATRLVMEKEIVLEALEMTGHAFEGTALEAVHFSQSILAIAGDLDSFIEAVEGYYDAFFNDTEKQLNLQRQLTGAFGSMDLELPDTRQGFRDIVEGLDLTTESGKKTYVRLMQLAEASDQYYSALEAANATIIDAQRSLLGTTESGTVEDIAGRYGLDPADITKDFVDGIIAAFTSADTTQVIAYADYLGVSVDQLVEDILFLADAFASEASSLDNTISDWQDTLDELYGQSDMEALANKYNASVSALAEEFGEGTEEYIAYLQILNEAAIYEYTKLKNTALTNISSPWQGTLEALYGKTDFENLAEKYFTTADELADALDEGLLSQKEYYDCIQALNEAAIYELNELAKELSEGWLDDILNGAKSYDDLIADFDKWYMDQINSWAELLHTGQITLDEWLVGVDAVKRMSEEVANQTYEGLVGYMQGVILDYEQSQMTEQQIIEAKYDLIALMIVATAGLENLINAETGALNDLGQALLDMWNQARQIELDTAKTSSSSSYSSSSSSSSRSYTDPRDFIAELEETLRRLQGVTGEFKDALDSITESFENNITKFNEIAAQYHGFGSNTLPNFDEFARLYEEDKRALEQQFKAVFGVDTWKYHFDQFLAMYEGMVAIYVQEMKNLMDEAVQEWDDIIAKDSMSDQGYQLYELNKWYEEQQGIIQTMTDEMEKLGLTEDDIIALTAKLTQAYEIQKAAIIDEFEGSLKDIINQDAMSDLGYQMLQLNEWYEEQKKVAEELGLELTLVTQAYEIQKAAIIDSFEDPLREIISKSGMTDLESAMYDLNKWYEEQKKTAEDLGLSLALLNQAYEVQKKEIEEQYRIERESIFSSSADYLRELSGESDRLADAMAEVNDRYDAWRESLIEAGASLQELQQLELDRIEALRLKLQQLKSSILSIFDAAREQMAFTNWQYATGNTSKADYYMGTIRDIQSSQDVFTLEELENLSNLMADWYQAAVDEAIAAAQEEQRVAQLWEQVAETTQNLVKSIEDAIKNIKYSALNVSLPAAKAEDAAQDYQELWNAAMSGGQAEIQEFISFVPTYLQQAQEQYKSSEQYQSIYASAMADLELMKSLIESGSYDEKIFEELQSINETIDVDLSDLNATFADMEAWIANALESVGDLGIYLNINWEDYAGDAQAVILLLSTLVDKYGWDSEVILAFITDMARWDFESIDNAILVLEYIVDNIGWDNTLTATFVANVANWIVNNGDIDDIISTLDYLIEMGAPDDVILSFISNLTGFDFDSVNDAISILEYFILILGWDNTATLTFVSNIAAWIQDKGDIDDIKAMIDYLFLHGTTEAKITFMTDMVSWLTNKGDMDEALAIFEYFADTEGWTSEATLTLTAQAAESGILWTDIQKMLEAADVPLEWQTKLRASYDSVYGDLTFDQVSALLGDNHELQALLTGIWDPSSTMTLSELQELLDANGVTQTVAAEITEIITGNIQAELNNPTFENQDLENIYLLMNGKLSTQIDKLNELTSISSNTSVSVTKLGETISKLSNINSGISNTVSYLSSVSARSSDILSSLNNFVASQDGTLGSIAGYTFSDYMIFTAGKLGEISSTLGSIYSSMAPISGIWTNTNHLGNIDYYCQYLDNIYDYTKYMDDIYNYSKYLSNIYGVLAVDSENLKGNVWKIKQNTASLNSGLGYTAQYSGGGIAVGPPSGYPAILHDTEAIVPIPNGYIPAKIVGGDMPAQDFGIIDSLSKYMAEQVELQRALLAAVKNLEMSPQIEVKVGDEWLDARISRVADRVRVKADRRNMSAQRTIV